jgi:hypothetical protein
MRTSSAELPAWQHQLGDPAFSDIAALNPTTDRPSIPPMPKHSEGTFLWTAPDLQSTGQDPAQTLAHSHEDAEEAATVMEAIVGVGQQNVSDIWQESLLLSSSTRQSTCNYSTD